MPDGDRSPRAQPGVHTRSWNLGAALLLVMAASAAAGADAPRVYLAAGVGAGYAANGSLDGLDARVDFDLGRPIASVALGLDTERGWRFELDGSYRYNDAEVVFFDDGQAADLAPDADSRISAWSVAASALYGFDLGRAFRPYLGAGIGVAWVDYGIDQHISGAGLLDGRDTVPAYQLIAGFELNLTRRFDLLVDYRYWRAPGIRVEGAEGLGSVETDHRVHSTMVNLRYTPARRTAAPRSRPDDARRGWYLHGNAGMSFAKDAEIKDNIANFDAFDIGTTATLAVGWTFRERWRLELEGSQRRNEAELIDFNPDFGENRASGRVRANSLMVNVIYQPGWNTAFRPYVGLGVGRAWSDWDVRLQADRSTYVDDKDAAAAFQVTLGAAAALTGRLAVTAEYRYWMTALFDLEEPDGRPMRTEHTVHSVLLGLRYTLR
jgi:opacity protein-like surface antigen